VNIRCVDDRGPTDTKSPTTLSHNYDLDHGPVAMCTKSRAKQVQLVHSNTHQLHNMLRLLLVFCLLTHLPKNLTIATQHCDDFVRCEHIVKSKGVHAAAAV